jgi:hypothetical protein
MIESERKRFPRGKSEVVTTPDTKVRHKVNLPIASSTGSERFTYLVPRQPVYSVEVAEIREGLIKKMRYSTISISQSLCFPELSVLNES